MLTVCMCSSLCKLSLLDSSQTFVKPAHLYSCEKSVDNSLQSYCAPQDALYTCRQGRYKVDPDIKFFALLPVHGSLAKYVDRPADFCQMP